MKHLLVPTDFSPEAQYALEAAVQLARHTGGRVTLLHVADVPHSSGFVSSGGRASTGDMANVFTLKLLQATKRRMHEQMDLAARLAPTVPVHDMVQTSSFEAAVLNVIQEQQVDLVVLGTRAHTSWQQFFVPSHAEQVVRRAPCPVLTVKQPVGEFAVRHLVFASDFSSEADRAVPGLRQLLALFPDATLHLLDVVPGANRHDAALASIQAFARRHQLPAYVPEVFDAPRPSVGIPRFAEQAHADLIVMLTHGHTGLSHFLHQNTAEDVALHAPAPVLTMHT